MRGSRRSHFRARGCWFLSLLCGFLHRRRGEISRHSKWIHLHGTSNLARVIKRRRISHCQRRAVVVGVVFPGCLVSFQAACHGKILAFLRLATACDPAISLYQGAFLAAFAPRNAIVNVPFTCKRGGTGHECGSSDTHSCWAAYLETAKHSNCTSPKSTWFNWSSSKTSSVLSAMGYIAGERLLKAKRPFTALMVFNDLSAIGAIHAFRDAGRRVSQQISVVGFDDIHAATILQPVLATVRQTLAEMGMLLASEMSANIEDDNSKPREVPVSRNWWCGSRMQFARGIIANRSNRASPMRRPGDSSTRNLRGVCFSVA
jgi:hypothetical protein